MRLERLEISGFKSFSDRAELAFHEGVTAIVGPNGCGKSNLADAITWVLGEQSAKSLRGERMEDVIFSGSDARKPGAAAEVRLRLTGLPLPPRPGEGGEAVGAFKAAPPQAGGNGNGHGGSGNGCEAGRQDAVEELARAFTRDVEVTRRLYRSGESEYLIDGEVCRLRDVHELLMDTGLGAKAYAIIEQGKIGMILSSRPADRRQLIEEAAGITKYKSRRRAAELKLEAAQQNLARIDDIVVEVERQRSTLRRQAAKARRYRRLREELRRWDKVLYARRYRELARAIEQARSGLAAVREREAMAAGHLAAAEADLGRLRIEQAEADGRAARGRQAAHERELAISRRQQQIEFSRQQVDALARRRSDIDDEIRDLTARREPGRLALEGRMQARADAVRSLDEAASVLTLASRALAEAQARIAGLEADVEASRQAAFAALNAVTAHRHIVASTMAEREKVATTLARLEAEEQDLRLEQARAGQAHAAAARALAHARQALEAVVVERAARESELADARAGHDARARELRAREQELAALEARLASLAEIAASRAEFSDAARAVLVQANGRIAQRGAVADYLEVDPRYERAVEACLGDLLQHVIVERHEQAAAGLSLVRQQDAGRCGFLVLESGSNGQFPRAPRGGDGVRPVSEVMSVTGPHAGVIHEVLPEAYIAEDFDRAVAFARATSAMVATLDGDVVRGPRLVAGGARAQARGILATRREARELGERVAADREALALMRGEVERLAAAAAAAAASSAGLLDEQHRLEKDVVGFEAQLARAVEDAERLERKAGLVALERRRAEEEGADLDGRRAEAEAAISRVEQEQRDHAARLAAAQERLAAAREAVAEYGARAAEARAAHAGLGERAAALAAEVERLEESACELEHRIAARSSERDETEARRAALATAIAEAEHALDQDVRSAEAARIELGQADEAAASLRASVEAQEVLIREARRALEEIRAEAGALEVACATAQSDLSHLAQACLDAVQCGLDDVLAEIEQLEQAGQATPDAAAIGAEEPDPDDEGVEDGPAADAQAAGPREPAPDAGGGQPASMTAEEAIAALKAKINRLGPVNMIAIEQFDELEARHAFLTGQRRDLVESIAQTSEAIRRIDETTRSRFAEAFAAIQTNFQLTFSTLFGGGRAGLTLVDENDPLESGIEIVASPPGKRLQSVQLLSGGEKALVAIALMFAIFRYKPSPFCLLDEIDAPLDDANIGRFVEMLRGMMDRTQFILITHNRRTMEIANRLYGVTMEEPGVSKLISVQLN